MGRDTRSMKEIKGFILRVDFDHRGYFRGNQAMDSHFRGCHYHIEHSEISQEMIKLYFERILEREFGAKRIPDSGQYLGIGYCNGRPANLSIWERRALIYVKGRGRFEFQSQSCILWIGKFGKLHIESNKTQKYVYSILKKAEIIRILQNWHS